MEPEELIMHVLCAGPIRRIDGRYADGFVVLDALEALIARGEAETYSVKGWDFVRLPEGASARDDGAESGV